jgi:D-sedoheptulose 7-phosphate isomerase
MDERLNATAPAAVFAGRVIVMDKTMRDQIGDQIRETGRVLAAMLADSALIATIEGTALACVACLQAGGKILLAGNGGSAADAQHIAAELVGRFAMERPSLAAIALTTDTSVLTSIGNDHGFEQIFARQVQAHGRRGDVFIAYSTSGSSPNILLALDEARRRGLICVGLTGNRDGPMGAYCDYCLAVPAGDTPRIQEAHLVLGHLLCGLVETAVFGGAQ